MNLKEARTHEVPDEVNSLEALDFRANFDVEFNLGEDTFIDEEFTAETLAEGARRHQESLDFINILDIRARLMGGGHQLILDIDRVACPVPGKARMLRFKASAQSLAQWASQMTQAERDVLMNMLAEHINIAVQHVREASRRNKEKERETEDETG